MNDSRPEYGLLKVMFYGHLDTYKDKKLVSFQIIRKLLFWIVMYLTIHLSSSSRASFKFPTDCRVRASPSAAITVSNEFHPCLI